MKPVHTLNILLLTIMLLAQACRSQSAESEQEHGSVAALDEKNGFQDVTFGMPLSAFVGMVPDENNKPDDYYLTYTRLSDKKMLGEIPLSLVEYTFYKGRLISIEFRAEGEENSYNVLQALRAAYGPGEETAIGPIWKGKNILINTMRLVIQESNKKYIRIDINSQEMFRGIMENLKRKREEKAKRDASDL